MDEQTRQKLTRRRWLVLIVSCLINLCIGALYIWSVFAGPMAGYLTELTGSPVTSNDLAIVFSVGNAFGFITIIGGGFITRRIGPRWVIFTGGLLFGLGFVICGLASGVGTLIVGYGLVSGLAMGLAYGCTISNSVKFFPDRAGLVGGIATASYGISSVILPPIAEALISSVGVTRAFIIFGIAIMVIVGVCSQFITGCPEGFAPSGWSPRPRKDGGSGAPDTDWRGMLRSPVFYAMLLMLFFGAVMGMMSISQASGIAQEVARMTPAAAAVTVSVLSLFNTFGRIFAGSVSDRIGCLNTITGVFVIGIAAMGLLLVSIGGSAAAFYAGICLVGVCFGAFMGVYPSFTAGQFGARHSSVNYGVMFIGFNAAGLLGPIIMSGIHSRTGSYSGAFLTALTLSAAGLVLSLLFRKIPGSRR